MLDLRSSGALPLFGGPIAWLQPKTKPRYQTGWISLGYAAWVVQGIAPVPTENSAIGRVVWPGLTVFSCGPHFANVWAMPSLLPARERFGRYRLRLLHRGRARQEV